MAYNKNASSNKHLSPLKLYHPQNIQMPDRITHPTLYQRLLHKQVQPPC